MARAASAGTTVGSKTILNHPLAIDIAAGWSRMMAALDDEKKEGANQARDDERGHDGEDACIPYPVGREATAAGGAGTEPQCSENACRGDDGVHVEPEARKSCEGGDQRPSRGCVHARGKG